MENYLFLERHFKFFRAVVNHSWFYLITTSRKLVNNNLSLPVRYTKITQYLEIIILEAFQTYSDLIFILKLPLIEQLYTATSIPLPIFEDRTGLYVVLYAKISWAQ